MVRSRALPVRDVRIAGLYAVTPDLADTDLLVALVDAALTGGAMLVQYRNKTAEPALRATQAARLAAVCQAHRRPLIINDHLALAMTIDGVGLHVGLDDIPDQAALVALRARLGPSRILGVSCYRSVDRARDAVAAGADYVAFGSVFPSTTKPSAPAAALQLFADAAALGIACVGIGGIDRDNATSLRAAGADAVAVISDLFGVADPAIVTTRATTFANLFR
ncbi:MAG: thiamine phosphate synthase [Burkholderiaceae bacterium]